MPVLGVVMTAVIVMGNVELQVVTHVMVTRATQSEAPIIILSKGGCFSTCSVASRQCCRIYALQSNAQCTETTVAMFGSMFSAGLIVGAVPQHFYRAPLVVSRITDGPHDVSQGSATSSQHRLIARA